MRVRVRSIEPSPVGADDEVDGAARPSSTPDDLGPNAAAVRSLIERASSLSPERRRRLADEERWRAWPIALTPTGGLAAVRASAYAHARRAGRPQLPVAIATAVRRTLGDDRRERDMRQAVADAALAVALADVLPEETRAQLGAAWRVGIG